MSRNRHPARTRPSRLTQVARRTSLRRVCGVFLAALASYVVCLAPSRLFAASAPEPEEAAKASEGLTRGPTRHYVHRWIPMPRLIGPKLPGAVDGSYVPTKGRAAVVIFLASWCEPCQQIAPELVKLERHFQELSVDFHFVFAHDTPGDAEGFMKEMGIGQGFLASQEILKEYHNPELPTIYVGDRHAWLATRYVRATGESLGQLEQLLKHVTAY